MGYSIGAGNDAATCTTGCRSRAQPRRQADRQADGNGEERADRRRDEDTSQGDAGRADDGLPLFDAHLQQHLDDPVHPPQHRDAEQAKHHERTGRPDQLVLRADRLGRRIRGVRLRLDARGGRRGRRSRTLGRPIGSKSTQAFEKHEKPRAPQKIEEPGRIVAFAGSLFGAEFLGPNDDRPPQKLVEADDHQRHRQDRPELRGDISLVGRTLHVRADARQSKRFLFQLESFARIEEEPPSRHAHHAVPDEPQCGKGELQLRESIEPREAIDRRHLALFQRDRHQRVVEAEGHVPRLTREDEQDRRNLEADVVRRKQRAEQQQNARHERKHRNRLQNVEHRQQHRRGPLVFRGPVAVDEREPQRQAVSRQPAAQRVERVARQRPGRQVDRFRRFMRGRRVLAKIDQSDEEAEDADGEQQIDPARTPDAHEDRGASAPKSTARQRIGDGSLLRRRLPAWRWASRGNAALYTGRRDRFSRDPGHKQDEISARTAIPYDCERTADSNTMDCKGSAIRVVPNRGRPCDFCTRRSWPG